MTTGAARKKTKAPNQRIDSFDLATGRVIGGKYVVEQKLGGGWEGEVYKVTEKRTGAQRAAKLFFPHRNRNDRAVTVYAKKLERLKDCSIVIQYHHSEMLRYRGHDVVCLISEFVDGQLLEDFVAEQPGKRLHPFEAMHLLYALVDGLEEVHRAREYHGDLHGGNVLVRRSGIFFHVKLVDFYHWGAPTRAHIRDDVVDLVRLFSDSVGGKKRYAAQPRVVKEICRGLRRDLIVKAFPTVRHLREFLEVGAK